MSKLKKLSYSKLLDEYDAQKQHIELIDGGYKQLMYLDEIEYELQKREEDNDE